MRTLSLVFAITLCLVYSQAAQVPTVSRISPIPLWPEDGRIPDDLKAYSVFLNPVTQEIVMSLPASSGIGPAELLIFELHNGAKPVVEAKVSRTATGLYVYEYALSAAPDSRKALSTWSLLVPGLDPSLSAKTSASWEVEITETDMVDRLASKHVPLKYLRFKAKAGDDLKPGVGLLQIRIESIYAPGYVTSFARGNASKELSPAKLAGMPKAVADQMARIMAPEFDSEMGLVLGPRFDADTPLTTVASSFDYMMQHFAVRGEMKLDSEFASSCTSALRSITQSGIRSVRSLDCLSRANSLREHEMADAMRMSLAETR